MVLVERRDGDFRQSSSLRRPLPTTPSSHPLLYDLPNLSVIRPQSPTTRSSFHPPQRPIHSTPLSLPTPDQSCKLTAAHSQQLIKPSPSSPNLLQNDRTCSRSTRCGSCRSLSSSHSVPPCYLLMPNSPWRRVPHSCLLLQLLMQVCERGWRGRNFFVLICRRRRMVWRWSC